MTSSKLLQKYNVPSPRYTSYPTVPYWDKTPLRQAAWKEEVRRTFELSNSEAGISLYLHLPFCESLCTFCGCNKRITKNHRVEQPYIESLLAEWRMYLELFDERPRIREIHLGGGTPTFFRAENLHNLLTAILEPAERTPAFSFSLEAHPNVTNSEQLQVLYDLGFRRLSLGVQDFNPKVQFIINRIQPYEQVAEVTEAARRIGYDSLNFDLVYGLPFQDKDCIADTVQKVKRLMPERIAFYSYAHVPWKSPGQRRYTEADLPSPDAKRALYETGREMLEEAGYRELGMDHFALPSDTLYRSAHKGKMHRNFMGYTESNTRLLIGLGASAISDTWTSYIQNEKTVEDYKERVAQGKWPFYRGHLLTEEDRILRQHILNLMCRFETSWASSKLQHPALEQAAARLTSFEADGLVRCSNQHVHVTDKGRTFIRNICMAFDSRLWRKKPDSQLFSQAI